MAGFFDFMAMLFQGLENPKGTARTMAEMNVSPEDFTDQLAKAQHFQVAQQMSPRAEHMQGQDLNWRERIQQQSQQQGSAALQGNYTLPTIGGAMQPQQPQQAQTTPTTDRLSQTQRTTPTTERLMQAPDPARFMGAAPATVPPNIPPAVMPGAAQSIPPQALPQAPVAPEGMMPSLGDVMQPTMPVAPAPTSLSSGTMQAPQRAEVATSPAMATDAMSIRNEAINAWRNSGINNPFALAALAATGKHESGFSPGNMNRMWSDPSEKGQAGTSGGMFSWRNERLNALKNFAKKNGEEGLGSPTTQALFYAQERPQVIAALKSAKSVEEAQQIMNNDIAFAGYNRPGGEAGRRLQTARTTLPEIQELMGQEVTPLAKAATGLTTGSDVGATAAGSATPTAASAPQSKAQKLADSLAEIGKSLEVPEGGSEQTPMGSPSPPRPGNLNVNPETMRTMLAMLGPTAGGVPPIPTLAMLMGAR